MIARTMAPLRLISAAAGLALLAGCMPSEEPTWTPSASEGQKTNQVELSRLSHTVRFAAGASTLSSGETDSLARFLDDADVYYGDHIFLEAAPSDELSKKRQAALRRALAKRGVLLKSVPASGGSVGERLALGEEMTLTLERYVVSPPHCPDWSKPAGSDPTNSVSSNFGCATATNLGLMVAQPRDLLVGRQPGPATAEPALTAVQAYRAHKPIILPDDISGGSSSSAPSGGPTAGAGGGATTGGASGG